MFHECRHIMPSGNRCHAAALRGKAWCYFHQKLHRLTSPATGDVKVAIMAPIEDAGSIKLALSQVLAALNSPYMDTRRASLMLYGLQIAAQLIPASEKNAPPEPVREVSADQDGNDLAPEKLSCEPGIDCPRCRNQDDCSNYEDPDDDPEFEDEEEEDYEEEEEEEDKPETNSNSRHPASSVGRFEHSVPVEDDDERDHDKREHNDEAEKAAAISNPDDEDAVVEEALRILEQGSRTSRRRKPASPRRRPS